MNINPIQMLKNMASPQQFMQSMMSNNQIMSNPMAKNALDMAQKGNMQGIEQMARNICKERGLNPDDVMSQIRNQFHL
jgi:type II secretory pathway component HofQ